MYYLIGIIALFIIYALYSSLKRKKNEKRYVEYLNGQTNKRLTIKERITKWRKDRDEVRSYRLTQYCMSGRMPSKRTAKQHLKKQRETRLKQAFECGGRFVMPIISNPNSSLMNCAGEMLDDADYMVSLGKKAAERILREAN